MTKKTVNFEAGTVTFDFENGKTAVFDIAKVSADIAKRLALHGASQKVGDSYAGAGEAADPVAYAEQAAGETIAQLVAGDWRVTSAGGPRVSDLAAALSRLNGQPVEVITEQLAKATDDQKKDLRKIPQVAAALAAIKAESAAKRAAKLAEAAKGAEPVAIPTFG
jgi:hypothetical protein